MDGLLDLAKGAGPWAFSIVLLLVMLKLVNDERKDLLRANEKLSTDLLNGLHAAVTTINDLRRMLKITKDSE